VRDREACGEGGDVQAGPPRGKGTGQDGARQSRIVEGRRRNEDGLDPGRPQLARTLQDLQVGMSGPRQDNADPCTGHLGDG
jgi:hypothetical protein